MGCAASIRFRLWNDSILLLKIFYFWHKQTIKSNQTFIIYERKYDSIRYINDWFRYSNETIRCINEVFLRDCVRCWSDPFFQKNEIQYNLYSPTVHLIRLDVIAHWLEFYQCRIPIDIVNPFPMFPFYECWELTLDTLFIVYCCIIFIWQMPTNAKI